jgi:hypothetical protein
LGRSASCRTTPIGKVAPARQRRDPGLRGRVFDFDRTDGDQLNPSVLQQRDIDLAPGATPRWSSTAPQRDLSLRRDRQFERHQHALGMHRQRPKQGLDRLTSAQVDSRFRSAPCCGSLRRPSRASSNCHIRMVSKAKLFVDFLTPVDSLQKQAFMFINVELAQVANTTIG